MLRNVVLLAVVLSAFCSNSFGCECTGYSRACERFNTDAVFVGRVVETVSVKHPVDKDSYSRGYSMRFTVEESLRGGLGTEAIIETGNGGGDCGTPLPVGEKFLIFAYREKDGKLWTGACSGSRFLGNDPESAQIVEELRALVKTGAGSIFGSVAQTKPMWREDDIRDKEMQPVQGIVVYAKSESFNTFTKTKQDGSYEFSGLPNGKYTVTPETPRKMDFDHEYEERYGAELSDGACANINFKLEPATRIRGHVTLPVGAEGKKIEVVALPTHLKELTQFSGKWDFADEDGRFDLWPLPPGDYYVGVNINSSPQEDAPFPPTYFPGVTSQKAAHIVHVDEGEIKQLELPLPEVAKPRTVRFVAIGLDGKPMRTIYIQREDLRHPGDAASYVNVDLDSNGAGSLIVYAGYSYHLHGQGRSSCSKPVLIPAGTKPVNVRFVMDRKSDYCDIGEIDGRKK
jgi:hypothetical protein